MRVAQYRTLDVAQRATGWARYRGNACVVAWPDGIYRVHGMDRTGRPVVYGPAFGQAADWEPARWWVDGAWKAGDDDE